MAPHPFALPLLQSIALGTLLLCPLGSGAVSASSEVKSVSINAMGVSKSEGAVAMMDELTSVAVGAHGSVMQTPSGSSAPRRLVRERSSGDDSESLGAISEEEKCLRRMGDESVPDLLADWNLTKEFNVQTVKNPHLHVVKHQWNAIVKFVKRLAAQKEKNGGMLEVLDIGGNSGKSYEMAIRNISDYTSFDFKPPGGALDVNGTSPARSVVGNIVRCNAEIPSSSYDVVMAFNTFEHILAPANAAREMIRLVRNGGYLIVAAPFSWRYHAYPLDAMRYTHTAMRFFFESTGDVTTLHTSYEIEGSWGGHSLDKSDAPIKPGPFPDQTEMMWIGRRVDGTEFDRNSLDQNAAFGTQVEGLPEPLAVLRCEGAACGTQARASKSVRR